MRLVSICSIADDMTLARTLYDGRGMMILPTGVPLTAHKSQLGNFNIQYVYVEDALSEGIEMSRLLNGETRLEIHETVKRLKRVYKPVDDHKKKTFFDLPYMKLGKLMAEDIANQDELSIDVTEFVINRVYDFDHNLNVGILSALIGRAFGMSRDNIYHLAMGGFLHDIGLLALPEDMMSKFGMFPFQSVDLDMYRQYPLIGYDMIKHNQAINLITKSAVLQHKEYYDGSGFPSHKKENEISQSAKIVAVANAFEKLLFGRDPDHGQVKIFDIIRYILQNAGIAFDPAVAAVFVKHLAAFPNGVMVKLNDGSVALVEKQNPGQVARPIVRVIHPDGKNWERVDLLNQTELMIEGALDL